MLVASIPLGNLFANEWTASAATFLEAERFGSAYLLFRALTSLIMSAFPLRTTETSTIQHLRNISTASFLPALPLALILYDLIALDALEVNKVDREHTLDDTINMSWSRRRRASVTSSVSTARSSSPQGSGIPDYLINEEKLKPRLAHIYGRRTKDVQTSWTMGNYYVLVDKKTPEPLNKVSR